MENTQATSHETNAATLPDKKWDLPRRPRWTKKGDLAGQNASDLAYEQRGDLAGQKKATSPDNTQATSRETKSRRPRRTKNGTSHGDLARQIKGDLAGQKLTTWRPRRTQSGTSRGDLTKQHKTKQTQPNSRANLRQPTFLLNSWALASLRSRSSFCVRPHLLFAVED
jgi:hypothetical protein